VTRIVIIVPKFAISVVYARNVAHQRVNVWTVCALKTLNMSIISALIADNASALLTNVILVIIMGNIVVQAAVIWL